MAPQTKTKVLDKVKRSFLRMASPFEFGGEEVHFDTLLSLNVPPMLARAGAAYERLMELLHLNVFSHSLEERRELYSEMQLLATESASNYRLISQIVKVEKKRIDFQPISEYLDNLEQQILILKNTAESLALLDLSSKQLTQTFGAGALSPLETCDQVYTEGELKVFHFVLELVDFAAPTLKTLREQKMKLFSKGDLARYARSFSEYQNYFRSDEFARKDQSPSDSSNA